MTPEKTTEQAVNEKGVIGIKGSNLFKIMALPIVTAFVSLFVMKLIVLAS